MSEFTVDSEDLALDWLGNHRDLWANAYSVTIQPLGYPQDPQQPGSLVYSGSTAGGSRMVISIQGRGLVIPEGAVTGEREDRGWIAALLVVSDALAIEFTDTAPVLRDEAA